MTGVGAMKAAPNRLVCGGRAVMVAPVRPFQMIALPALKPTPPEPIHAR
jgi:hypothetical protein